MMITMWLRVLIWAIWLPVRMIGITMELAATAKDDGRPMTSLETKIFLAIMGYFVVFGLIYGVIRLVTWIASLS